VGFGEVRGNCQYVTGDTPDRLVGVLCDILAPLVLGQDPTGPARIADMMDAAIVGNSGAKAVIDIAIYDLLGKALKLPAHMLLGGKNQDRLPTGASIAFSPPEKAYQECTKAIDDGFTAIKARVGIKPFRRDIERVEAIRRAIDDHPAREECTLGMDANGTWGVKEAIRNIKTLTDYGVTWVEQPVAFNDFYGLKEVRDSVDIMVMADEACKTPQDVLRLVEMRAADDFHLKLCKAGGPTRLRQMMSIAEAAGLPYLIGQMDEGMLATAAAVQCAVASRASHFGIFGYRRVGWQPITGLVQKGGVMGIPDGFGLGVEVDETQLDLVRTFNIS